MVCSGTRIAVSGVTESGFDRHLRILAVATGLGTVIFTLLALPAIIEQQSHLAAWFSLPLTVLFCGLPVALIPLGRAGSTRSIVWTARVQTIVAAVLVVFWAPAMTGAGLPGDRAPWVLNTMAVAAATAVIGWKARTAWAYLVAITCAGGFLRYVVLGGSEWVVPFLDGISMLTFCAIIASLLMVTLWAGHTQDVALASALNDASAAAEAESRARQRTRFGSLVHDQVITTLLAATADGVPDDRLRKRARNALAQLDAFVTEAPDAAPVTPRNLEVELRSAARELADGVKVTGSLRSLSAPVPRAVASALMGALAEGMRNSVRHAPGGAVHVVRREVTLKSSADSVTVELVDDGCGFEVAEVPQARLGIRTSIVARMAAVEGGSARVVSAPGEGTRVLLSWAARAAE